MLKNSLQTNYRRAAPTLVTLVTLFIALFYMGCYLGGELRGNINWFFLPGKMFGTPAPLAEKGIAPLYLNPGQTGWDGQFYYYIANDLRGTAETAKHIDAPSYRYQRIGLPALAKAVSVITFHKWVSPKTYYLTYLLLILLATYILADFFQKEGYSPWLTLFWSLSLGTQLTLINGLPDAAADSWAIISIIAFLRGRFIICGLAFTLAALSREAYVFLPALFGLVAGLDWLRQRPWRLQPFLKMLALYGIPVLIWGLWQLYIRLHFHRSPSSEALGILGWPLATWWHYFVISITFTRYSAHIDCIREAIGLLIFLLLLVITIWLSIKTALQKTDPRTQLARLQIALFLIVFCLLYSCFGFTVIMDYTGYMKAAALFMFSIPLLYVLRTKPIPKLMLYFLIFIILFFAYFLSRRIDTPLPSTFYQYSYYFPNEKSATTPVACYPHPRSKLQLIGIENFYKSDIPRELRHLPNIQVFLIKVTNLTGHAWPMTYGAGATRLSYQWLNAQDQIVQDGSRTFFHQVVKPGETVTAPAMILFPQQPGEYRLVISLVQENCVWFYRGGDPGAIVLTYKIL